MKILLFAGAGFSEESNLQTFRDTNGLWNNYEINDVCNFLIFKKNKNNEMYRKNLLQFYNDLKNKINNAQPNEAHKRIAYWQSKGIDVHIYTTNVDDLFERANCVNVHHLHGDLNHLHCAACNKKFFIGNNQFVDERCKSCNSRLTKPNVVFYYETGNYKDFFYIMNPKRRNKEDIFIIAGASMEVLDYKKIFGKRKNSKLGTKILMNIDNNLAGHYDKVYHNKMTKTVFEFEKDYLNL